MAYRLTNCRKCRRISILSSGERLCRRCLSARAELAERIEQAMDRHGVYDLEELASLVEEPVEEVTAAVDATAYLRHLIAIDRTCKVCRREPAQEGSVYCLGCRLSLNRGLNRAVADVRRRIIPPPIVARHASVDVSGALERKRRRLGTVHGRLTPRNRWSG